MKLLYCHQLCGHILWAGETWLWPMRGQLMVPKARTEAAIFKTLLLTWHRGQTPTSRNSSPCAPFLYTCCEVLIALKNAISSQVCPACCTHPVAPVLQDFCLLQARNLHRCQLNQPRFPLARRAMAKSCCIFSGACFSLAGKCKHQPSL